MMRHPVSQMYSQERWAVWYLDTFDREAPARIDVSGQGLVEGLAELWARFLFETVQAHGQKGFSSFHLAWKSGKVTIEGNWEGARRLRDWLFGKKDHTYTGYVQEAEPALLERLAYAHACLIGKAQATQQILTLAMLARNAEDFVLRLEQLTDAQA